MPGAFLHDECVLSLGLFSLAQCPEERWQWFKSGSEEEFAETLGNLKDIPPSGVQSVVCVSKFAEFACAVELL